MWCHVREYASLVYTIGGQKEILRREMAATHHAIDLRHSCERPFGQINPPLVIGAMSDTGDRR